MEAYASCFLCVGDYLGYNMNTTRLGWIDMESLLGALTIRLQCIWLVFDTFKIN